MRYRGEVGERHGEMSRGGPERSPAVQPNCESLSMLKTLGERLCRLRLTFFSTTAGEAGEREGECGSKRAVRDCALTEVGWMLLFKVLINTFDCCSLSKPVRGSAVSASAALSWVFWLASWALAAAERRLLAGKELLILPFCWLFCCLRICLVEGQAVLGLSRTHSIPLVACVGMHQRQGL